MSNHDTLRILHWNCMGGLSRKEKIAYLLSFNADIAIIPEIRQSNIDCINAIRKVHSSIWETNNFSSNNPKGLGVLSFGDYKITELPRDKEMEIFLPLMISRGSFSFSLLALWNFYSACKQGRFKGLEGPECLEYSALRFYEKHFKDPSLVVGDWNLGPTFSLNTFLKLGEMLNAVGLKSLYHEHHGLQHHQSNHFTFRSNRNRFHHIDHIFGSEFFHKNMNDYHTDSFTNVVLSDHAPILLEINIKAVNDLLKRRRAA